MARNTTTQHPTRCLKCKRVLTSAASIAAGYGPTCLRNVRAAARTEALAAYKPHQVAKAVELIELAAMVPLRGHRVFMVASGERVYRTHVAACTCPAGVAGKHVCKHRIAAHILGLAA